MQKSAEAANAHGTSTKRKKTEKVNTNLNESTKPMTEAEMAELKRLEGIIEGNLMNVFEIGDALIKIKKEKLYRAQHKTFEEYCLAKWGFGRAYGYRHINAAKVYSGIKGLLTDVNTSLPQSEAQARRLVKLKDEPQKMLKAWNTALKQADGGRVTEEIVANVVAKMTGAANRKKGAAKTGTDVAPASELKPAPVVDHPQILELLETIRARLEEDNHREVLKCVVAIELLLKGDEPTKTDEAEGPRVEEQHEQEDDEQGEEEHGDDAETDEETGAEHDGEPGEVVMNRR